MASIFLLLAMCLAISWSSSFYGRKINPITVFLVPNLFSLTLLSGSNFLHSSLSLETAIVLSISGSIYLVGVWLAKVIRLKDPLPQKSTDLSFDPHRLCRVIVVLSVVYDLAALSYLADIQTTYGLTGMFSRMSELNVAQQSGDFDGIFSYALSLGFILVPLLVFLISSHKKGEPTSPFHGSIWPAYLQLILCFLPLVFSARRSNLFTFAVILLLSVAFFYGIGKRSSRERFTLRKMGSAFMAVAIISVAIYFLTATQQLMSKSFSGMHEYAFLGIQIPDFLIDPYIYIAGNYAYFDITSSSIISSSPYFLAATLRIPYMYISRLFGFPYDDSSIFSLPFINISTGSSYVSFNTKPIIGYALVDLGVFYWLAFFAFGFLTQKAYAYLNEGRNPAVKGLAILQLTLMFWSFRSYDLIFLTSWIAIASAIACGLYLATPHRVRYSHKTRVDIEIVSHRTCAGGSSTSSSEQRRSQDA